MGKANQIAACLSSKRFPLLQGISMTSVQCCSFSRIHRLHFSLASSVLKAFPVHLVHWHAQTEDPLVSSIDYTVIRMWLSTACKWCLVPRNVTHEGCFCFALLLVHIFGPKLDYEVGAADAKSLREGFSFTLALNNPVTQTRFDYCDPCECQTINTHTADQATFISLMAQIRHSLLKSNRGMDQNNLNNINWLWSSSQSSNNNFLMLST